MGEAMKETFAGPDAGFAVSTHRPLSSSALWFISRVL